MFNYIKKILRKTPDYVFTIGTLIAAAQINYAIVHSPFVYAAILVMLIHELGHYFTSRKYTNKSKLPIFIPLPFFVVGVTKVSSLSSHQTKHVAAAGPVYGLIAAALLNVLNFIFKFLPPIPMLLLLVGEIAFNYFGADGAKYRKAKKDIELCIS